MQPFHKTLGSALILLAAACSPKAQKITAFMEQNPSNLSAWGVVAVRGKALTLGQDVVPYDLNTPLYTDAAHKLRTLWIPPGKTTQYREGGALDFPVGTVLSKTFYYPKAKDGTLLDTLDTSSDFSGTGLNLAKVRLMETRILVHRENGWVALPYIWNAAQTEAVLERTGGTMPVTLHADGKKRAFTYIVPNTNQCTACHATNATTKAIAPIGPAPRHLNKPYAYQDGLQNQLERLAALNLLTGFDGADEAPRNANWRDEEAPLDARARAYLDINCGHCHNPTGAADTSALYLDRPAHTYPAGNAGHCKPPIAAGQGTGGKLYDIVPGNAEASILWYRMNSTDPAVMMPELGRSTIDARGVALIKAWIDAQEGDCR